MFEELTMYDKIELARIKKEAQHNAKCQNCIICGKACNSFCDSHIIPKFILKKIAKNGYVMSSTRIMDISDDDLGINKANTFQVICKDCDKRYFAYYEDDRYLENKLSNIQLASIALKNTIMQIAKRLFEIELYKILKSQGPDLLFDKRIEASKLDLIEYNRYLKINKKIIDNNTKSDYITIFHYELDYQIPICIQSELVIDEYSDIEYNDVYNYSKDLLMQGMHIYAFPINKNKSIIGAFYHKNDRIYHKLENNLRKKSKEEKIKFLNYLIFKYCENYYIYPDIKKTIFNDIYLKKLSKQDYDNPNFGFATLSDILFKPDNKTYESKITNILSEEYSIKKEESDD